MNENKRLIVYGTLAPNAPNHHIVAHIKGIWQECVVRGRLLTEGWGSEDGYLGFEHCPPEDQVKIKAYVLTSDELTKNWEYLDDFEGSDYKRILTKYELEDGTIGVGNIYAVNELSPDFA